LNTLTMEDPRNRGINIKALDSQILESQNDHPGRFAVTRKGDLSEPLVVPYDISGSAGDGIDYRSLDGFVFFDANQDTTYIKIWPNNDQIPEAPEDVVITLVPDS